MVLAVAAVLDEEGVQVEPLLGFLAEATAGGALARVADETDEASGLSGRVEEAACAHRLHVRADEAIRAVLVLSKDLDQSILVVLPDLQVLLPPLLGIDEEQPLSFRVLRVLQAQLRAEHVLAQTLFQVGNQLDAHVQYARRDLVLCAGSFNNSIVK